MRKGRNYMEYRPLNFNKPFDSINSGINTCIEDLSKKTKLPVNSFSKWK